MQARAGKSPLLAAHLDLMSAEQWKGLLICLLYAGTSTAISMVNKVGSCHGVCDVAGLQGVCQWVVACSKQPRGIHQRRCLHNSHLSVMKGLCGWMHVAAPSRIVGVGGCEGGLSAFS